MSLQEEGLKTKIILASASPRRKAIFRDIGLDFEVAVPEGIPEKKSGDPVGTAVGNSMMKARNVRDNMVKRGHRYLISGFDTIVYFRKKVYGKPSSMEEAYSFIRSLSGNTHQVVSGICIIDSITGLTVTGSETSEVRFRDLEEEEIRRYLEAGDVLDKAGAYNIAEAGALLVEKLRGCFFNVVGVPVFKYISLLERFDYKTLYHCKE